VSPETAATASDTLGGAIAVADRLPPALGAEVLAAGREAFVTGLQLAATVSGVLVIAAALLVARLLRREDVPAAALAPQGSCA
jgi:DHA2 family multidrug resistance protein-like MFS transporter